MLLVSLVIALRQTVGAPTRAAATVRPRAVQLQLKPRLRWLRRADAGDWACRGAVGTFAVEVLELGVVGGLIAKLVDTRAL